MAKINILYVSTEIDPFVSSSKVSEYLVKLPVAMHERGFDIRILVPRFGNINERKNRLHEVVRLSGTAIPVGDDDKPLIIKVASLPTAKIQVYFIDNEDCFQRKATTYDKDGNFFADNDERSIFFCKGAIETVRKLGWSPNVVHCNDWFTALLPYYLKTIYKDDPIFAGSKILYSVFNNQFDHVFEEGLSDKISLPTKNDELLKNIKSNDFFGFIKIGMQFSDKIIRAEEQTSARIDELFNEYPEKTIDYIPSSNNDAFKELYTTMAQ
jgi:starch synthase